MRSVFCVVTSGFGSFFGEPDSPNIQSSDFLAAKVSGRDGKPGRAERQGLRRLPLRSLHRDAAPLGCAPTCARTYPSSSSRS